MKWTYSRIQEYVRRVRQRTLRSGCRKCKRRALTLGLVGTPSLSTLAREGYGLDRIKSDIRERGLYCKSCAMGHEKQQATALLKGWAKEEEVLLLLQSTPKEPEDKREWSEDRKLEYCVEGEALGVVLERASECFEEGDPMLGEIHRQYSS